MKSLLATTAIVAVAWMTPAQANVIITINESNDFGASGVGPYAQVEIHYLDSTHATAEFTRFGAFSFGEMGLDINAGTFGITNLAYVLAPTSVSNPTYTVTYGGKVGGIGNFALDYTANPNGFSDAVVQAKFTITNQSGTWANETQVLTTALPSAAIHAFNATGGSFFASDDPPGDPIPEPATMALLGVGLLGTLVARRRTAN